jgi:hypothetical protein
MLRFSADSSNPSGPFPVGPNKRHVAVFHQVLERSAHLFTPKSRESNRHVAQYLDQMAQVEGVHSAVDALHRWSGEGDPSISIQILEKVLEDAGEKGLEILFDMATERGATGIITYLNSYRPQQDSGVKQDKKRPNWYDVAKSSSPTQAVPAATFPENSPCLLGIAGQRKQPVEVWINSKAKKLNYGPTREWLTSADMGGKTPVWWLSHCNPKMVKNMPIYTEVPYDYGRVEGKFILLIKPPNDNVRAIGVAEDDHFLILWWGDHDEYEKAIRKVHTFSFAKSELLYRPPELA